MNDSFIEELFDAHNKSERIPSPSQVCNWLDGVLKLLFPELSEEKYENSRELALDFKRLKLELFTILKHIESGFKENPEAIEFNFFDELPKIRTILLEDAKAILLGDPAATTKTEVIRSYPGFYAIAVHRIAHFFYLSSVPLIPRVLTEHAHSKTGIDIHPGAKIGRQFCIDHGTGIVIGETAIIGDHVKIYQGVTLGALSVRKEFAKTKRHPTIQDNVVIYSGATILGGQTIIGHDSMIGGNVWLTESVPPHSRIYYDGKFIQKEHTNPS